MAYKIGHKVSPVLEPRIVMMVDTIQTPERYHCHWFVDGEVKDSWFGPKEIQKVAENGDIGFNKVKK